MRDRRLHGGAVGSPGVDRVSGSEEINDALA
jgi:hypothetical protein